MAATAILLLLLAAASPRDGGATKYTVGESDGWTIGPNYDAWSQQYNFTAGDTLGTFVRRCNSLCLARVDLHPARDDNV
jgi:hypothetical protein